LLFSSLLYRSLHHLPIYFLVFLVILLVRVTILIFLVQITKPQNSVTLLTVVQVEWTRVA